jgi:methanogenic corrinoid protein MtbC1/DNA-binding XRE family transcriptional regulator
MSHAETIRDLDESRRRYEKALADGDPKAAGAIVEELIAARYSSNDVYFAVIGPAMVQVGDLWCRGEIGVGNEHLATQIVLKQLDQLRHLHPGAGRYSWHRVLIGCVEGEEHFVGARMFADLCGAMGWIADFLGPNTPTQATIDMICQRKPQLVALSVTMSPGVECVRKVVEELSRLADIPELIIGGQAVAKMESWRMGKIHCHVARDILHGLDLARTLLRRNRPKAVLREYLLELGRRVRELRNEKGWTQEQLAQASRVTRVCIVAVEGGKQNVSMDIVVRIANALDTEPERLLINKA